MRFKIINMFSRKFIMVLGLLLLVGNISIANSSESDIRYRAIVYLYPNAIDIKQAEVEKYFIGFEKVVPLPDKTNGPSVAVSLERELADSYPVPGIQHLSYFGRGISKVQAESIQESKLALIIDIAYPLGTSAERLKASSASLFEIAKTYGGLIWDSETRELFSHQRWNEDRIKSWNQGVPNVEKHTVIHAYNNDGGVRAITLGMAKFGLPDIVVNNFSWSLNRSVGNLVNLVAQSVVEGSALTDRGTLKLNISALKDTQYKQGLISTLKDNAEPKLEIMIGEGKWEEGDPNNYLIELLFENIKGDSLSEKQERLISSLFGWEDEISYVKHNKLIQEASERAKGKLSGLEKDFNNGLSPGEFIQLKAPFKTPEGGNEWMWVEVLSWKGNAITGLLKNEPHNIPGLRGGAEVVVVQNEIFDYIRNYPDGNSEGNETGKLIMKYQN